MDKITLAIQKGQPISLKTSTLPPSIENLLDEIIEKILIKYQREDLKNALLLCVKEITGNAKKANLKRVYFRKNGFDINNSVHYSDAMSNFKQSVMDNLEMYFGLLEQLKYFIQITFQYSSEGVIITVSNNAPITNEELERIQQKYQKAINYEEAEDAFMDIVDQTEGAGLGIIMIVLMLKKEGINPKNYTINSKEGLTVARLAIHFNKIDQQKMYEVSEAIAKEVKTLPPFPENISRIRGLLRDKDANLSEVAKTIKIDPSLSADLLKLANSAQFMLPRKVSSIDEAIKIVGLRGLEHILASYGTKKILDERYGEMMPIWEHSYRVAFYAQELAKNRRLDKNIVEDVFLGGLLHDLGRYLIIAFRPDLIDKLDNLSNEKKLQIQVLEDLAMGITHAKIGALLAEKWNFPELLVKTIEFHHDPIFAEDKDRVMIYTVYLANALCNYQEGDITLEELDKNVLDFFNLKNNEDIQKVSTRLKELYDRKQKLFE